MIIILEGFDESGKSTLAKQLSEITGFKVLHPGKRPIDIDDAIEMMQEQKGLLAFASHCDLIMDRVTCISSFCYTWGSTDIFAKYQIQITDSKHIIVIHCKYNGEKLTVSEHDRDGSVDIARKNKDAIIARYNNLFKHIKHIEYDYKDTKSYRKVVNNILKSINKS